MATPEIRAGPWKISAGQPHAAGAHLLQLSKIHHTPSRPDTVRSPLPRRPALLGTPEAEVKAHLLCRKRLQHDVTSMCSGYLYAVHGWPLSC